MNNSIRHCIDITLFNFRISLSSEYLETTRGLKDSKDLILVNQREMMNLGCVYLNYNKYEVKSRKLCYLKSDSVWDHDNNLSYRVYHPSKQLGQDL